MTLYGRYAELHLAERTRSWQMAYADREYDWIIQREGDLWCLYFAPRVTA